MSSETMTGLGSTPTQFVETNDWVSAMKQVLHKAANDRLIEN